MFHIAALRIGHSGSRTKVHCQTHLLHLLPMSRHTREYGRTSSLYNKEWAPPSKHNARNSYSGWSKRGTRGNPAEHEGRFNQWDEGKSRDSAKDNEAEVEVEVVVDHDKSHNYDGTGDVEGVAQVPKASDSALADEMLIRYDQSCGNYNDSSITEREVQAQHTRKMPRRTPEPMTSTKRLCRLWTPWRRSTRSSKRS